MEPSVIHLLFVTVLPTVTSIQRQFHLIRDQKSWPDAQAYCRTHYNDLATVENDVDLGRIQREAQKLGFTSEAWVGLYNDITSWRCSRDEVPLRWTDWGRYQPNNALGNEECVAISNDIISGWFDLLCLNRFPFICYDETIVGPVKFVNYSAVKTWKEAQAYCRENHTDLACPNNNPENDELKKMIANGMTWIGFHRDGWKWSDRTNGQMKWFLNMPDNYGGNQNCAHLMKGVFSGGELYHGWYDDQYCLSQEAFVCQSVLEKREVLRVVVESDQDVNDPAVKSDLLKKIQQRLVEQGLEAATLRWREQSDGTVFYKQMEEKRENNTTCEL